MRKFHFPILFALLLGGVSACMSDVDPSVENYDRNDKEIQDYVSKNALTGTARSSGLYYSLTTANPAAKQAATGEEVEFTFKFYNLTTNQLVDSTVKGYPTYYPLGIGSILPGLEEGLSLMREGERATLLIPSYLAYGGEARTNLPAYSAIKMDVTLNRSRSEDQQIDEYVAAQNLANVEKTGSGLRFIKTQSNPAGATPAAGQTLTVKYAGRQLRRATAFDSTLVGREFMIGQSVKGFDEGLSKLKVGEKATIIFPSSLGYGTKGAIDGNKYIITPYAPLRFDIEIVSAK